MARRWLARVAVAIVSLFILHAAALNVFLSTSLFDKVLNGDPGTIYIAFERGWSIWPGRVHAKNLLIRSSDSNVQFILRLDRCDFSFSPLDLALHKTFHVTQVTGTGISFQGRERLEAPSATPEFVEALPAIPGFERIPLPVMKPKDVLQRWNDDYFHLWTVTLENVDAQHVREVWVDAMRWEGDAHVTGGFHLKPIREVSVTNARVAVDHGRVTIVKRLVAEPMTGHVNIDVAQFDPRLVTFMDIVRHVKLETDLQGRTPDLANLPRGIFRPALVGGPVEWRQLAFHMRDGKIAPGTRIDAAIRGGSYARAEQTVVADLGLVAEVAGGADRAGENAAPQLTFRVDAQHVKATRARANADAVTLATVATLAVIGDSRALDLTAPLADLHAVATLPAAEIPDLVAYETYVPETLRKTLALHGGRVRAHGGVELWVAERRARGHGELDASELDLGVGKLRARGEVHADGAFDSWWWEVNDIEGATAHLRMASATLAKASNPDVPVVAVAGLEATAVSADVDLDAPLRELSATVAVPEAVVHDRGLLAPYLPRAKDIRVTGGEARFDAHAEVTVHHHQASGALAVQAPRLGFEVDQLALTAALTAQARFHGWALDDERGLLASAIALDDASVRLSGLAITKRPTNEAALSVANVEVSARSERLRFADPLSHVALEAHVQGGTVRDALAVNAFLAKDAAIRFDAARSGGGRFAASVMAIVDGHVGRGRLNAKGSGIGVRGRKVAVLGDVDVALDVDDARLDEGTLRVRSSHVAFSDIAVRIGEANVAAGATAGAARAPELVASRVELDLAADRMSVASPALTGADYRLVVKGASMPDVRALGELMSSDPLAFAVESGKANADIDIRSSASEHTASGHALIVLEDAGVRLHETRLAGNFQVAVQVKGVDPELDGVDLSGSTVTMRDVRTAGAKAKAASWDGEVTLVGGGVRITQKPVFDGFIQLRADDANPVLALALQNSLPKFLVGMLKASQLTGQARVVVEPGRAAILGAHVRGGDVVMVGNYVVADHHVRGAVTVAKGPLSAGVRVDDAGTHVRLGELDAWLKEQTTAALGLFHDPRHRSGDVL